MQLISTDFLFQLLLLLCLVCVLPVQLTQNIRHVQSNKSERKADPFGNEKIKAQQKTKINNKNQKEMV